ncbi:MAG: hypothetical protein ACRD47_11890 [Nitrososphaeraceae archaeon]
MDSTNFRDFITESDKDKNSNQYAVVEYHGWHLLPEEAPTVEISLNAARASRMIKS